MSNRTRSAVSDVITDLALAINQSLGVHDVRRLVVEKAVLALKGSSGSVMMPPSGRGPMRVVAWVGGRNLGETETLPESPVAQWVVEHDEPMLLLGRSGPLAHLLHREDIRDSVCVPLRYAGRVIGALSVSNSEGREPFSKGDVDLLTSIGHLAAVALQNTLLYDEAREQGARAQAVLHQLWTAQEDERRRVAADLHDGPAQGLFNIVFRLQTARSKIGQDPLSVAGVLEQAEGQARETLSQLRAVMSGLRPMSLDDLGLVPALRNECAAVTARGRVRVDVEVKGKERRLRTAAETGIFHIAREALCNAEKHSGADQARLEMHFNRRGLLVSVADCGRGFDEETLRRARKTGHIGLAAMRERAEALGITLTTESQTGKGTRIAVECPFDGNE